MIFKTRHIATWLIEKPFIEEGLESYKVFNINQMIKILKLLNSYQLFKTKKFQLFRTIETEVDNDNVLSFDFWDKYFKVHESFIETSFKPFRGTTTIYFKNKPEFYYCAINLSFLFVDKYQKNFSLILDVMADDFSPNYMINRLDINPNYERNHGRLNAFLKELKNTGYKICPEEDDDENLARVHDLKIHNLITSNNSLIMYDEHANIIKSVDISSVNMNQT